MQDASAHNAQIGVSDVGVDYVHGLVGKIQQVNDSTGTYAFVLTAKRAVRESRIRLYRAGAPGLPLSKAGALGPIFDFQRIGSLRFNGRAGLILAQWSRGFCFPFFFEFFVESSLDIGISCAFR